MTPRELVDRLVSDYLGNYALAARVIGISASTLRDMHTGKVKPKQTTIERLVSYNHARTFGSVESEGKKIPVALKEGETYLAETQVMITATVKCTQCGRVKDEGEFEKPPNKPRLNVCYKCRCIAVNKSAENYEKLMDVKIGEVRELRSQLETVTRVCDAFSAEYATLTSAVENAVLQSRQRLATGR